MSEHAALDEDDRDIPQSHSGPLWKRALRGLVTLAFLVLVFGFVLPQLADYRAVAESIRSIAPLEWLLLAVFAGWFLVAYVFVLRATMPTLRLREGFVVQTTATAINNSLPAGGAIALPITYSQLLSWGFSPGAVTAALLTAGVWDQLMRLSLPVVAVGAIAIVGDALWWMWVVSLVGIAWVAVSVWIVARVLASESTARRVGTWLGRLVSWVSAKIRWEPVDMVEAVLRFRATVRQVAARRWRSITVATLANHASMAALFLVSLRAVGVSGDDLSTPWIILAFALGRLLVMVPISPGGLGLVDLGFIGLLTLGWGSGADTDLLSAGVLLYRALSYFPPIPVGVASWLFWRVNRSWRRDWRLERRGETAEP